MIELSAMGHADLDGAISPSAAFPNSYRAVELMGPRLRRLNSL